jgi:hypothetical protein
MAVVGRSLFHLIMVHLVYGNESSVLMSCRQWEVTRTEYIMNLLRRLQIQS